MTEIHEHWASSPLVAFAADIATQAGEPTTLRTLEELLDLMNELEERFPGVPFAEVLADKAAQSGFDTRRLRATLRKNGACQADIALVCPGQKDPEFRARKKNLESGEAYGPEAVRL